MTAKLLASFLLLITNISGQPPATAVVQPRQSFLVKQVVPGMVYLDGGTAHGLHEGMRLTLKHLTPGDALMGAKRVANLVVVSVATQSALAELQDLQPEMEPQVGDRADLTGADAESAARLESAHRRQRYAQVITFTSGDPLEEEVREYVPMPQLSEVGRLKGRIGFEQNIINDRNTDGSGSHQEGISARFDWTRIDGTYWSLTGYWRGRWNSRRSGQQQQTLTDLINRTYTIGLFYNNPRSKYIFGFGRVLIPWVSSLSTIDGGYAARRITPHLTAGLFAGTTPDPTQWNYDPNRQMLGLFASIEQGSFEKVRWTATAGAAVTRVKWRPERQFLFLENSLMAGNVISILHSMEVDQKNARLPPPPPPHERRERQHAEPELPHRPLPTQQEGLVRSESELLPRTADLRHHLDWHRPAGQVSLPGIQRRTSRSTPGKAGPFRQLGKKQARHRYHRLTQPDVLRGLDPPAMAGRPAGRPLYQVHQLLRQGLL